ncbi:MAG TPA: tRNA pseudouridine(38-40) synthase TruA [Candidatus Sulfotelmatobacter sp.]|nr:tRNA pseudouridine(38-40) synthase TruA [Candidatus Sulfotelmatobacter sp.]
MPRYKLTLEYDGTGLVGWQRQTTGPSVQQFLEEALVKLAGRRTEIAAAGRTDAGVHATGQVVHVDVDKDLKPEAVCNGLNYWLRGEEGASSVIVLAAELAPEGFHARFSAVGRQYLYRISNRRAGPVLEANRVWWVPKPLNAEAMHEAAQRLVGHYDFTSFRSIECQAQSPMKTMDRLDVVRVGDEIRIVAASRSFLHHQVRNMVGTLKLVGDGKWNADRVTQVLQARDRSVAGPTAPPYGLYLTGVSY